MDLGPDREKLRGFYFITDSGLTLNGIIEDTRQALEAGVALVQYREKEKGFQERLGEAKELLALCRGAGVPLIVNDGIELAKRLGLAGDRMGGVHLGQEDAPPALARAELGPDVIVGVSVGGAGDALGAATAGAPYVATGPVFETSTKPDAGPAIGIEGLRAVRAATTLPLAAIGGLDASNVGEVARAGADMICAISASLAGGKVAGNVRAISRAAGFQGETA